MGDAEAGRVPSGQALVSDQAPAGLDPSGFDPSRDLKQGDWVVVRSSSYSRFYRHEYAVVDSVKQKTAYVKRGAGRRLSRVSLGDIIPAVDEQAARLLCQKLDGVMGEAVRRQRDALDAYKRSIGKLYLAAYREALARTKEAEANHG